MDDFNKCPIGARHEEQIEATRKVLNMAIQRLEEKVDDIKEDVKNGFDNVDIRFNNLEDRFNTLENSLPNTVDDMINQHDDKRAAKIIKWVLVSLLGSTLILVFGRWVLTLLKL